MTEKSGHSRSQGSARDDGLEGLGRLRKHFGRYAQDTAGILLIALAILALLATWGLTAGGLVTPFTQFLAIWLGWGVYLLIAAIAYAGASMIRRGDVPVSRGRLVLLEAAALLGLGLLAIAGGNSLVRADAGLDGGRVGWGISYLLESTLGSPWGAVALAAAWLLSATFGLGLWAKFEKWLTELAEQVPTAPPAAIEVSKAVDEGVPTAEPVAKPRRVKSTARIPAEFRQDLGAPEAGTAKTAKPAKRDDALPSLTLLLGEQTSKPDERTINQTAGMIVKTLSEFGIPATVMGYRVGPAVTQFAVQPGFIKKSGAAPDDDAAQMKVRVAQIANLQKDLALALSAERLRIEAPVPGKPYVGIEVPNAHASVVRLRPLLESEAFQQVGSPLAIALGRDVSGNPVVADLARMPHLLIAGATGSGKSVCITSLAACLASNNAPTDLRMIMIDSKMVELLRFNGLAHLYGKVETDIERIQGVLRWVVIEMEHRYRLLEGARARDLDSFNRKQSRKDAGRAKLPRIVVLIDELADLMMSAPDQTEHNLVRLAQMARATGIHLVVATQRPSTDVVTGVIKANFPARLAFAVTSGVDSRVVLDMTGAETLLGRGDMLFLNPEVGNPLRAQGALVTDMEIERLIDFWQKSSDLPAEQAPPWEKLLAEADQNEDESLLEQATSLVRASGRASASLLQRRLRIGYPRAARLLDQLEEAGVVGPSQGGGREREVLQEETDQEPEG
ncbi:MAG: DNA translocase FtsK [Anaerolineales bacterium]